RVAMMRVRSRLERDVDDAAARAPVLRVVGVGLDLEFLRRVDGRNERDRAPGAHAGDAVDEHFVLLRAAAVDRHTGAAGDVERAQVAPGPLLDDARREPGELERIAPGSWNVEELLVRDDGATTGGVDVENPRLAPDPDRF